MSKPITHPGISSLGEGEYAWYLLERIEDRINRIYEYVEIEKDQLGIHSLHNALGLYEVGTLVETTFRKIVRHEAVASFPSLQKRSLTRAKRRNANILDYRNVLEPVLNLSRRSTEFRLFKYAVTLIPFGSFSESDSVSPAWWLAYNSVKHDINENMKKATLERLIEGAAAAFLLTVLYPGNWPSLIVHNRLSPTRRSRRGWFMPQNIDGEIFWTKLFEAFFPHFNSGVETFSSPVIQVSDVTANSRLFFSHLAHFDPDKKYVIP